MAQVVSRRRKLTRSREERNNRTRFLVVRHAESVCPASTRLSRKGSLQALAIAQTLRDKNVVAVYTSDRSIATARTISKELRVKTVVDSRLNSIKNGVLLGLSESEIQEKYPVVYEKRFQQRIPDFKVPQGESLKDRSDRVIEFLKEMVKINQGRNIVVVTHGGVIDDMYRFTRSLSVQQLTGLQKPYGSISVLEHRRNTDDVGALEWEEREWVGVKHLPQVVGVSPTGGQLYLFPHQVAGSFPLLRGDLGELCKPATQGELDTYERMKSSNIRLRDFTPLYLGVLTINVDQILLKLATLNEPFEKMINMPCDDDQREPSQDSSDKVQALGSGPNKNGGCKIKRRRHSFKDKSQSKMKPRSESPSTDSNTEKSVEAIEVPVKRDLLPDGKDPWSVTNLWNKFKLCRKKKVIRRPNGDFVYLILENLTHGMNCPVVMDLKVGTQQHGSNESEAKKQSKIRKCKETTSSTLGLRIAGMQTYDESESQYVLRDKYWGRSLDETGVEEALKVFVSDENNMLRLDVIRSLVAQITALIAAIKDTKWRFYGCSVLLVYDAKPRRRKPSYNSSSSEDASPDESEYAPSVCPELTKKRRARSQSFDDIAEEFQVTLRLIDFAKTEMDEAGHDSYDSGFLFGLNNLKEILIRCHPELRSEAGTPTSQHPTLTGEIGFVRAAPESSSKLHHKILPDMWCKGVGANVNPV
mmetsp:Transcript_16537/g.18701  ORF Transcript_16537/g.18701 Transcript_16537/m.18701 type:complete len:699 (+) Transcript_16537:385-2481(+)